MTPQFLWKDTSDVYGILMCNGVMMQESAG